MTISRQLFDFSFHHSIEETFQKLLVLKKQMGLLKIKTKLLELIFKGFHEIHHRNDWLKFWFPAAKTALFDFFGQFIILQN